MSVRRLFTVIAISSLALLAIACGSNEIPEAGSAVGLEEALESAGLRINGPAENDFLSANYFSIPGVQYEASGETIFVYEFTDDQELAAQQALVSPDGWGIGHKFIQWSVGPSYYQNGNLIVIYDGDKRLIMDTLTAAMGEPFAGGSPV